jgi:hypothetical protein
VDHPGRLLPSHQSDEISLDLDPATLADQQKKAVADRERAIVVGRYEFQTHVVVTEVHSPTARLGSRSSSMRKDHRPVFSKRVINFKTLPSALGGLGVAA